MQQWESTTEKPQPIKIQSTSDKRLTVPTDRPITQFLSLQLWLTDQCGRKGRKSIKARETGLCCEIISPRNVREATPMKSHQHGCLNKT